MKKERRLIAAGAALALLAAGPAAADVHLAFAPPAGLIECTGTLAVDITVDAAATDLRGFSLVLAFDPAVVEIDSVYAGPLLTGASCSHFLYPVYSAGVDSLSLDGATLGCSVAGPGTIATVVFRALPQGSYPAYTQLVWRSVELRDGQNATIPTVSHPGYIDVTCVISVEPSTWSRTKTGYRDAKESP